MRKKLSNKLVQTVMIGPTVLWLLAFLLAPLIIVVGISFLTKNAHGGVNMPVTLEAYKSMANLDSVSYTHLDVYKRQG